MPATEILCVGEVVWDALPAGLFLGGAPFNVACHLAAAGLPVSLVSRVGRDHLGDEAVRRAAWYGVHTDLVQRDDTLPTGLVRVTVDAAGAPSYEIVDPAAWDAIAPTPELLRRAADARAIVFGSLAQRRETSRRTIERLGSADAVRVFDANLRPPHDDAEVVRASLARAAVAKLTEAELRRVAEWFRLPDESAARTAAAIAETFGCRVVCVTRGSEGAGLWHDGRWTEHPGFEVEVRDTVGTGDAFLAVLLAGLLRGGADDRTLLRHANLAGAYVATQAGAVPADQPAAAGTAAAAEPPAPATAPRKRRRR
jgi:fructokinase